MCVRSRQTDDKPKRGTKARTCYVFESGGYVRACVCVPVQTTDVTRLRERAQDEGRRCEKNACVAREIECRMCGEGKPPPQKHQGFRADFMLT